MKNIFSDEWKYKNIFLNIIFLLSFSFISSYILYSGYSMSTDSVRFSRWADNLIELKFNYSDFFLIEKIRIRPHLFFFSLPVSLIALCKVIFANQWQLAFLLLNLLLVFFSLIIFVKSLLLIGVRPILIGLSLPVIVISVDILIWPKFILSDMIYAFLVLFATYFVIKGIIKNKNYYLELFLIILLLLASRPASIPVIFIIIFFTLFSNLQILSKKKNILFFLFIIFISIPFILGLVYSFIETNFSGIPKIDFLTNMVKIGMIIHDRPNTWVDVPSNFVDVVYIYFLRLANFFNPYASGFSIIHIVLNFILTFVVSLSILGWIFLQSFTKNDKIFLFILILSLSVAAFHSFILIDYDWRYRFPVILPLIILFPISLENFLKKINFN